MEELGNIPGSMGARSYIGRGKGSKKSFFSCSHGAGRQMSRGAAKKRSLVTSVMERAHVMRLVEADFTASLRATQSPLILTDEANIPSDYWRPQPPRLDRQGLIRALKAGHTIEGATLGNGGLTISVRTG